MDVRAAGCIRVRLCRLVACSSSRNPPRPQTPARSAIIVIIVIIEIVESAARPIRVEPLTEDELIHELHALGLPCGVARFDDRVIVVTR